MEAPKQPQIPVKQIEEIVEYCNLKDQFAGGSLEFLLEQFKENGFDIQPKDYKYLHFNVKYNSESYAYLEVIYAKTKLKDNPNYETLYQKYLENKRIYEEFFCIITRAQLEKHLNEKLQEKTNKETELIELNDRVNQIKQLLNDKT